MKYILIFLLLFWPVDTNAYIDPSSGSYLIQVLLSVVLGGFFAIKIYWKKIKLYFSKLFFKNSRD